MRTSFSIKGLDWPGNLYSYQLLGPINKLGKFRWYYAFATRDPGVEYSISCVKVNHHLMPIASGGLVLHASELDHRSKVRAIAECCRNANPL